MTALHLGLKDLPSLLTSKGVNVITAPYWLEGQCRGNDHYMWEDMANVGSHDNLPMAYMVHHAGTSAATPPPFNLSKGNAWGGLLRDGKLYQSGDGIPTIYLASAGPARISAGYGYWPAFRDYTAQQKRCPWDAEGPDGTRDLNNHAFSVETVHKGDGSAIDPGVWQAVVTLGICLEEITVRKEMTMGHLSWTVDKVDPRWSAGLPNDGNKCIIDIQEAVAGGHGMTLERWVTRLRPEDIDQMGNIGVLNPPGHPKDEVTYWQGKLSVVQDTGVVDAEWQDLRDAVEVRSQLWA